MFNNENEPTLSINMAPNHNEQNAKHYHQIWKTQNENPKIASLQKSCIKKNRLIFLLACLKPPNSFWCSRIWKIKVHSSPTKKSGEENGTQKITISPPAYHYRKLLKNERKLISKEIFYVIKFHYILSILCNNLHSNCYDN